MIEKVWVESCKKLSLERKCPITQGNTQYYALLSQDITTRLIECNEGSLNLMNTTILRDSIEKKKV